MGFVASDTYFWTASLGDGHTGGTSHSASEPTNWQETADSAENGGKKTRDRVVGTATEDGTEGSRTTADSDA